LMVLSGLSMTGLRRPFDAFSSTYSPSTPFNSVTVPIPLPDQALVVLGRVQLVDHGRIVHGNGNHFLIMLVQDGPRPLARRLRALQQVPKQCRSPDHGMSAPFGERRDHR